MAIERTCGWAYLILRTGSRAVLGTGWHLRDGMTAQPAAASGPGPATTSGLVAA